MNQTLLRILIQWGPTVLFVLGLLGAIGIGFLQGMRKTIIFLAHAVISASICLILFFTLVNNTDFDRFLLNTTNSIMGGEGSLQEMLDVNTSCSTFREILHEYIPKQLNFMDGIALIVEENGRYLDTLVDMSYRVILGLVLFIFYYIIFFLACIIYDLSMRERKYKIKRTQDYENGFIDTPYRKKRIWGAVINGSRNLVGGLLMLSFIGTLFYVVGGGTGNKNEESYTFEDSTYNLAYGAYQAIGDYGSSGIYKILNLCKDSSDTPYYLYAADLVFQGGLTNEEGIRENIYFRDEMAAYVSFSRDTFDLVLKYGKDEILDCMSEDFDGDVMDVVIKVMGKEGFNEEFRNIITEFESKTYFLDLTLSLLDSCVNHIDSLGLDEYLDPEIIEMIKIVFKQGYKSEAIPYEAYLKENDPDYELAYIAPSKLLTKEDVYTAYDIFADFIKVENEGVYDEEYVTSMIKEMLPDIKNLSILSTSRASELNPVFERLYAYLDAAYLTQELDLSEYETEYASLTLNASEQIYLGYDDSVDWVSELYMACDVADKAMTIYKNLSYPDCLWTDIAFGIYDTSKSTYEINSSYADEIIADISNSRILGDILSSHMITALLRDTIGTYTEDMYIPDGISYSAVYDTEGRKKSNGELADLLYGIRFLLADTDNKALLDTLTSEEETTDDVFSLFMNAIPSLLITDSHGKNAVDYLSNSTILVSFLSSYFTSDAMSFDGYSIYIDDSIKVHDSYGNVKNMIEKEEFSKFFYSASDFFDLLDKISNSADINEILDIVESESFRNSLDSKLIEGTINKSLPAVLNGSDFIVIPSENAMKDNLISTENSPSEIRVLSEASSHGLELNSLMDEDMTDEEIMNSLVAMVKNLTEENLEYLLTSNILYYSISNYLIENSDSISSSEFEIIIPNTAEDELSGESISHVIKKNVLSDIILNISLFIPDGDEEVTIEDILGKILENDSILDNPIVKVTLINALCNNDSVKEVTDGVLYIPEEYQTAALPKTLKDNFTKYNIWNNELKCFILSLDTLMNISGNALFSFDDATSYVYENFTSSYLESESSYDSSMTKLDYIYQSDILMNSLSHILDDSFSDIDETYLDGGKVYGTDIYKESEIKALLDAMDIFGISLSSGFNADDLTNKVKSSLKTFNVKDKTGKTKLDRLYESCIVRYYFTDSIDSLELLSEVKQKQIKDSETGAYQKSDIASLIDLLNILNLNLEDENLTNDITASLSKLLDEYDIFTGQTNLSHLYEADIFPLMFTQAMEDNENISVPTDAYLSEEGLVMTYVNEQEAYNLINAVCGKGGLNLDMKSDFSVTNVNLDSIDPEVVSASLILNASLYTAFTNMDSEENSIIIPQYALNDSTNASNIYIEDYEIADFFTALIKHKTDLFGEPKEDGTYSISNISVSTDNVSPSFLMDLSESTILTATIVNMITNEDLTDELVLPDSFKEDGTMENISYKRNNSWLLKDSNSHNELYYMGESFDSLGMESLSDLSNNPDYLSDKVTPDTLLHKNYTDSDGNTMITLKAMYMSKIIAATISDTIADYLTEGDSGIISSSVKYSSKIYSEKLKAYTYDEIYNFLNGYESVGISSIEDLSTISVDDIIDKDRTYMYKSYLILGIITASIKDEMSADDCAVVDSDLAYYDDIRCYRKCEVESLLTYMRDDDGNKVDIASLHKADFSLSKVLDNIAYTTDENGKTVSKSYITVATLTDILKDNRDIVIPKVEYETRYNQIKCDSMIDLVDALLAFGFTNADIDIDKGVLPTEESAQMRLAKSGILSASIVPKLSIKINGSSSAVFIEDDATYVTETTSLRNDPAYVLTEEESLHMIKGLVAMGASNLTLEVTTSTLKSTDMNVVCESSLLKCTISESVIAKTASSSVHKEVINVTIGMTQIIDIFTAEEISAALSRL